MSDPPPTRPSLLARIRDPRDGVAWGEFVDIYGPLVYDYGRRRGLQDADAADLTQDVLRAVAAAADRFAYDPARGAFRSWLFTVTRRKLLDSVRRRRPGDRGTGDTDVHKHLEAEEAGHSDGMDEGEEGIEWDQAFRQRLLDWAAGQHPRRVPADDLAGVLALRRRRMRPPRGVGLAGDEHRGRVCGQVPRAGASAGRDRAGTA